MVICDSSIFLQYQVWASAIMLTIKDRNTSLTFVQGLDYSELENCYSKEPPDVSCLGQQTFICHLTRLVQTLVVPGVLLLSSPLGFCHCPAFFTVDEGRNRAECFTVCFMGACFRDILYHLYPQSIGQNSFRSPHLNREIGEIQFSFLPRD